MPITGEQYEALVNALAEAYPTAGDLTRMVQYRLGTNLARIATASNIDQMIFELVRHFDARGEVSLLVVAARAARPNNPALFAAAQMLGLAPASPDRRSLERVVRRLNKFLDVDVWTGRLGELEGQVCRVEVASGGNEFYGTGFLVGPDVVLTNFHVVASALTARADGTYAAAPGGAASIRLRFDYRRSASGAVYDGTVFELADDCLLDASPPSPLDTQREPRSGLPDPNHLDYALLRLATPAGRRAVGAHAELGACPRGWVRIPNQPPQSTVGSPILILQHPSGEPLKLAFDTDGIIAEFDTRVRYATNTKPGSSGSPCFDLDWTLMALHHSGDRELVPEYNEGIPVRAIRARLERLGLLGELKE